MWFVVAFTIGLFIGFTCGIIAMGVLTGGK
jgi:hypothetical protein